MNGSFPEKVVHGGKIKQIREDTGRAVIDFSANLNPFVPPVSPDFSPDLLGSYPDDRYMAVKEAISARFNRPVDEIAVGNGSIELIRVFCLATLSPGTRVRIMNPTFGEYELSARLAGALPASPAERAHVRFICNPNNPTGDLLPRRDILDAAERCSGGHLFVDEAFIELSDPAQSVADVRDPALFILRSLTKCFSVPGIRFGYAFGAPDLVRKVETIRPPWSVNTFAEQFALAAFRVFDGLETSRKKIAAERVWLVRELSRFSLTVHPSAANFLLLTFPSDVGSLCTRLLESGILVRDCHSFGLPDSIRIAIRTRDENRILVEVLERCLR
ncbi:MAG: pyridoxal phosphate-dependent class II aminotransferase [Methanomicrobiales archaeon]|nr:pyridoxal phosphate-dependent class II aminotransferase [Methanomicrobiales archaeon]NYT21409.1 pyridoxal phosphate-dependent class II aminotransferase [Methanomicrobiales archaeon]